MLKKVTVTLLRDFYTQKTLKLAKEFLGKFIVRKIGNKKRMGMIVETEAYVGPQDRASHAFGGKVTPRNKAEYMAGGHIYIYLVYGMYWQLNISTGREGRPECVLIRALEPIIANIHELSANAANRRFVKTRGKLVKIRDLANGPGKLCRWLKLDKSFYAEDLTKSKRIWLEDRGVKIPRFHSGQVKKCDIVVAPRVGIDYAGPLWSKKPWRFYIKDNPFVSKL